MSRDKRKSGRRAGLPEALIAGATFAAVYGLWQADLSVTVFLVWAVVALVVGGILLAVAQSVAERRARLEGVQEHGERS